MTSSENVTVLARLAVVAEGDVGRIRKAVSRHAELLGFDVFDRTRLITAASELARNMLAYAGRGKVRLERLDSGGERALRVAFDDLGPGIEDVQEALADGFSSGSGLGLGLGGARRLVDDFVIDSKRGSGTRIAITRWLRRSAGRWRGGAR